MLGAVNKMSVFLVSYTCLSVSVCVFLSVILSIYLCLSLSVSASLSLLYIRVCIRIWAFMLPRISEALLLSSLPSLSIFFLIYISFFCLSICLLRTLYLLQFLSVFLYVHPSVCLILSLSLCVCLSLSPLSLCRQPFRYIISWRVVLSALDQACVFLAISFAHPVCKSLCLYLCLCLCWRRIPDECRFAKAAAPIASALVLSLSASLSVSLSVCSCVCVYLCVYACICVYVCVCISVYVSVSVSVYVSVCVCISVFLCLCLCLSLSLISSHRPAADVIAALAKDTRCMNDALPKLLLL